MMKKIFLIAAVLFFISEANAQSKYVGHYRDFGGHSIDINTDSTFEFTWRFDLQGSWTKGKWSVHKDTIYFTMIPVYDTLIYTDSASGMHILKVFL
jgi:hypothetical protein